MRISCLQANLKRALGAATRAGFAKALPITQNVLISTDQGRLRLDATNLEIVITAWIGAQIEEEGAITIPSKALKQIISSFPDELLTIETSGYEVSITCGKRRVGIYGTEAEDFPPIPTVESGLVGKFEAAVLRDAIKHVAFAAATEDSRPVLTGIKVEITGQDFTFAAADGFRLAVYKGKLMEPISEDTSFIIPGRALQEVNRLIGSQQEPVEFTVTKSQVLFRLENVELVSQLIQGTFPNYSQFIPQSYDTRVVVDLGEFLRATRTASIFANDIVRLQIAKGCLTVSAQSEGLDSKEDIDATVQGAEAKIAFNSKYLAEVLDVLGKGSVALETTTPASPGVLRPVKPAEGESTAEYIHVVTPVFVQW